MNLHAPNFIQVKVHMTGNAVCNLIIDTGADISLFKAQNIRPGHIVNIANTIQLTGIRENTIDTLGVINTDLYFNNFKLNHDFRLVPPNIPIQADGILGRDFLTKYRYSIMKVGDSPLI